MFDFAPGDPVTPQLLKLALWNYLSLLLTPSRSLSSSFPHPGIRMIPPEPLPGPTWELRCSEGLSRCLKLPV
jgi:hypothetical protein